MILTVFKAAPHFDTVKEPFIHLTMVPAPTDPTKKYLEITVGGGLKITPKGLTEVCLMLDAAADAADKGIDKILGETDDAP